MMLHWLRGSGLGLLLGMAVVPASAGPAIQVVDRQALTLEIRPLTAGTVESSNDAFLLHADDGRPSQLELQVLWPDADEPSRLRLTATRELGTDGERVRLESDLVGADGVRIARASREMVFASETATALFEVARRDGRVLTLAVSGELTEQTVFSARPLIGPAVSFELEIRWFEQGRAVTLETNQLNTFVGQQVSYAFRLGQTGEAAALSVRLTPARLVGDTLRIEVEVDGTLPDDEDALAVVARKEQWLATSGTTSSLSLTEGEPPTGFQFVVTARF